MEKLGEVLPPPRFTPPTYDDDELNLPPIYNKWKEMRIKDTPKKIIPDAFKPEAGVIVMNTLWVNPREKPAEIKAEVKNPIESVVNLRVNRDTRVAGNPTISFSAQQYFGEGLRLSQEPKLCAHDQDIHPIYKFIPENIMKYSSFNQQEQQKSINDFGIDPSRITLPSIVGDTNSPHMRNMKDGSTFSDAMRGKDDFTIDPIYMSGGVPGNLTKSMMGGQSLEAKKKKKPSANIFDARVKPNDVPTLKAKLAKEAYEIRARKFQADEYKPPHQHTFRDHVHPLDKPNFLTGTKVAGLKY